MKLTVLGATGGTGKEFVEQALAEGHEVTVLVRNAAKVSWQNPKLKVVVGDATKVSDVEKALRGTDAVVGALGPRQRADPICAKAAEATVAAMKSAGVSRVVWTSASGVGDSAGPVIRASFIFGRIIMPLFLRVPYANHLKAEETLRASGLEWTVLRPLQLVDKPTGAAPVANDGSTPLKGLKIARSDLAKFILAELKAPAHIRQMPMLHT